MEEYFPGLITIFGLFAVGYVGHIMFTPSIYQFVTTPRSAENDTLVNLCMCIWALKHYVVLVCS